MNVHFHSAAREPLVHIFGQQRSELLVQSLAVKSMNVEKKTVCMYAPEEKVEQAWRDEGYTEN